MALTTDHSAGGAPDLHEPLASARPDDQRYGASDRRARRPWPLWLRGLLAAVLLGYAAAWVLGEPSMSQGPVLLRFTAEHGIDMRDIFAAPLALGSAALIVPRRFVGRR